MLNVLKAAVSNNRRELLVASEEMSDAKNKEEYEEKLGILQTLTHDVWLLRNGGDEGEVLNLDIKPELIKIAEATNSSTLAHWLGEIETIQENFIVNINKKVATDALFIEMAAG